MLSTSHYPFPSLPTDRPTTSSTTFIGVEKMKPQEQKLVENLIRTTELTRYVEYPRPDLLQRFH